MTSFDHSTRELWHRLQCPCNLNFTYANYTTFMNHFDTRRHDYFEQSKKLREYQRTVGSLNNRNAQLSARVQSLNQEKVLFTTTI